MSESFKEAYTDFSKLYDVFMEDIPYKQWCNQIVDILKKEGINDGIVAELGCGTGSITALMSEAGYDMIGIDNSYDMLNIAKEKDENILYLLQDMREFELYGTCRAIISRCDSINYILNEEDLLKVFKLVNNYLDPKGLFIFDINSLYKYEHELSDNIIAENSSKGSFIWENYFDNTTRINECCLTVYVKNDKDLYERSEEIHYQKAYTIDEIKNIANKANLDFCNLLDADTNKSIKDDTQRYLFIFREKGK